MSRRWRNPDWATASIWPGSSRWKPRQIWNVGHLLECRRGFVPSSALFGAHGGRHSNGVDRKVTLVDVLL